MQRLEFEYECPRNELLLIFLENNGKNLKEFYISKSNDSLNSAIIKFCPNIRNLFTGLKNNELETLKMFFNSLKYLESVRICYEGELSSEKDLFDVVAKYSPKNFYELELKYSKLLPVELESFFISWKNRIPQKSLSLIINGNKSLYTNDENKKIIEKYVKLGVVKIDL